MTTTLKNLYSGTIGNTSTTLYTVPASTTTIVKEINICNKTASATTVTILYGTTNIINGYSVGANSTYQIPLHDVLPTGTIITAVAGASATIDLYVSGVEVA